MSNQRWIELTKALRMRLAAMSLAESYAYYGAPNETRMDAKEKLERHNLKERRMIVSILTDIYANFSGPII